MVQWFVTTSSSKPPQVGQPAYTAVITQARQKARDKARKLSKMPAMKENFNPTWEYKCWGKAGHKFANKLVAARRNKQVFDDAMFFQYGK